MLQLDMVAQEAVGVTEETVFTIYSPDPIGKLVVLENLDSSNNLTWRFQTAPSASGSWTDVAADATLNPGDSTFQLLSSSEPYVRLRASGNLNISITVLRHRAFNDAFSLAPL